MAAIIVAAYFAGPMIPKAYAWNISAIPMSITTTPGSTVAYSISTFYDSGMEPPVAPVDLLVSPPEFGITVDFLPSSGMVGFSSTMRVQVDPAKPPGVYTLLVWAHVAGAIFPGPGNKAVNVQLVVQPAAPAATDWALSDPTLSPASPNVGDPVTFQAILAALSTSQPYPQSVTLALQLDGGVWGGDVSLNYPGPTGSYVTIYTTTPWIATAGAHTITWAIGSGVPDPNPSNNRASRTFTVGPPPAQFGFEVLVSPTERTITPGSSASYTVSVNLLSGSAQSVILSLSGKPGGVTETFSPSSGSPTFSSSLTLSVASSVSPGSYSMTVTGNGGGRTHEATIKLTVSQAADFRIDVSPPSVTVSQGQAASYSVSIVGLNGFNSPISLSVAGLPPGVNPVFTVPSGTPDFNSVLTMNLPSNVQTGSFTLQITALGGGITKVANVMLVIMAATGTQTQTQTQITTATTGPYDILQQDNLLFVAVLVIAAAALLALLLRRRSAAHPASPPPPANPCPVCGKPLTFVKQYDRWYCNSCKEYK